MEGRAPSDSAPRPAPQATAIGPSHRHRLFLALQWGSPIISSAPSPAFFRVSISLAPNLAVPVGTVSLQNIQRNQYFFHWGRVFGVQARPFMPEPGKGNQRPLVHTLSASSQRCDYITFSTHLHGPSMVQNQQGQERTRMNKTHLGSGCSHGTRRWTPGDRPINQLLQSPWNWAVTIWLETLSLKYLSLGTAFPVSMPTPGYS